ncbi:MAG TPA: TolC family protein [Polyangiaceae bacterium]|nr:TolC family protein [Polyangiaceae bacterium]
MDPTSPRRVCAALVATFVLTFTAPPAWAEGGLAPVTREGLLAELARSHPEVQAAEQRAVALERGAQAQGSLPAPAVMAQLWSVPLARPYALGDANMLMLGVEQGFPAPGSLGAKERAATLRSTGERANGAEVARQRRRELDHAFADYVESTSRHRVHGEHRALAERTLALARARHAGGGSLVDVAQAEVELARMLADVVTDGTRVAAGRGRINALLGRPTLGPLGPPLIVEAETSAWDAKTALEKAKAYRPALRATAAQRAALAEDARAAKIEATVPSFKVAALYFAPVGEGRHGYGFNAGMSLPWLWGEASARRDAAREAARAGEREVAGAIRPVEAEVATAEATVRAAALRLVALRERAVPASRRALDVARAGYEAGRADALAMLYAERVVVDVETSLVEARATLDHALAELDAAVGAAVPRRRLVGAPADSGDGGASHVR